MKTAVLLILTGLLSACSSFLTEPALPVAEAPTSAFRKKILVLRFINKTAADGDALVDQAFQDVRKMVAGVPDLVFVGPEEIDGYERFLTDGVLYNHRTIMDTAKSHGIAGVIMGSIENVELEEKGDEIGFFRTRLYTARATIHFQLFDVGTGREVATMTSTGQMEEEHTRFFEGRAPESEDALHARGAVSKAIDRVVASFSMYSRRVAWSAQIAKVESHRYYINAGEQTGVRPGQLLKVFGESFPVSDTKSGTLLGMAPGRFKGILKVVDFLGPDGAIAVLHSGAGVRERDRVELFGANQP